MTVDTGCNTGSGSYTVAGDQITFGPLAMTLIACEGITNDVEQAQLAVLTGTATATVTDGVLTLTNGDRACTTSPVDRAATRVGRPSRALTGRAPASR